MVVVLGITVAGVYKVQPLPLQSLSLCPARVLLDFVGSGFQACDLDVVAAGTPFVGQAARWSARLKIRMGWGNITDYFSSRGEPLV